MDKKLKFTKMLELYYLDKRRLSDISKTIGISASTAHKWFKDWSEGKLFNDIPKPKLNTEEILKISKGRYL